MQADAYSGFNRLYEASAGLVPSPRRCNKAAIAIEAVRRIDELFAIERDINGKPPPERKRVRQEHSPPLVTALEAWLREQLAMAPRCHCKI